MADEVFIATWIFSPSRKLLKTGYSDYRYRSIRYCNSLLREYRAKIIITCLIIHFIVTCVIIVCLERTLLSYHYLPSKPSSRTLISIGDPAVI